MCCAGRGSVEDGGVCCEVGGRWEEGLGGGV